MGFARAAAELSPKWCGSFVAVVERAAAYHDLGKLDELFQEVLRHNRKNKHGFNHVEAGTAHSLRLKQFEAAFTAYAHLIGLPSFPKEKAKFANGQNLVFRDTGDLEGLGQAAWPRTDEHLDRNLQQHHKLFAPVPPVANQHFSGVVRRLALSCLVDADHSDTAQHYRNEREVPAPDLRAAERLSRLDEYVAGLPAKNPPSNDREQQRLKLRQDVYRACREREAKPDERIFACDSPVGTGNTTAVVAHLLRVAAERKLRRVFIVLPFTNITDQSVDVYRRALCLAGESKEAMEQVIAAHHHRVDFSSRIAFRESCGLVNLLQISGRSSRSGEFDGAEVWDFRHDAEGGLLLHPQAKLSRRILEQVFAECADKNRQPGPDDCTEALQREILQNHGEKSERMEEIFQAEKDADYPHVAKLCRIIDAATYTVRFSTLSRSDMDPQRLRQNKLDGMHSLLALL